MGELEEAGCVFGSSHNTQTLIPCWCFPAPRKLLFLQLVLFATTFTITVFGGFLVLPVKFLIRKIKAVRVNYSQINIGKAQGGWEAVAVTLLFSRDIPGLWVGKH